MSFTALFDACVLHPAVLRDLLLQVATTGLFRARWSATIHEEWMASVLRARPELTREQLARTRELMDAHSRDCLVTRYEGLMAGLKLPDPKDRHVLAAAIRGRADVIVTYNLSDFPAAALAPYDLAAQHPDDFLGYLCDLHPEAVCVSARVCRARMKRPPLSVEEYLGALTKVQLPQTVAFLGEHLGLI